MDYAIGDIHGCFKTMQLLLQKMNFNSYDSYYFLGDYIDRGPESKRIMDFFIDLNKTNKNIHLIRGNHEQMMINTYKNENLDDYILWRQNGSESTLNNFGIYEDTLKLLDKIPFSYIEFFETLPFYHELDNFLLVHGGFNFHIPDPFADTETMLWTREDDYNSKLAKGKTIIHGHTPTLPNEVKQMIKQKANSICIDTGCVFKKIPGLGYLSALNLNTMELISVYNIDF